MKSASRSPGEKIGPSVQTQSNSSSRDGAKDAAKNKKLVHTLTELETALTSWEALAGGERPTASTVAASDGALDSKPENRHATEMRNRTRALLEELKRQIDCL